MQDQQLQTQILGVHEKTVNTKNGPKTMYQVQVEGGTVYTTFLKDIADRCTAAVFQNVTLTVRVSQNGDFINRYIQAVGPLQTQPTQTVPATQFAPPIQPVTSHIPDDGLFPPKQDLTVTQADDYERAKNMRIARQTACKVAAMLVQPGDGQLDFWQNVDQLIQFFDNGIKPLAVALQLDERAAA